VYKGLGFQLRFTGKVKKEREHESRLKSKDREGEEDKKKVFFKDGLTDSQLEEA